MIVKPRRGLVDRMARERQSRRRRTPPTIPISVPAGACRAGGPRSHMRAAFVSTRAQGSVVPPAPPRGLGPLLEPIVRRVSRIIDEVASVSRITALVARLLGGQGAARHSGGAAAGELPGRPPRPEASTARALGQAPGEQPVRVTPRRNSHEVQRRRVVVSTQSSPPPAGERRRASSAWFRPTMEELRTTTWSRKIGTVSHGCRARRARRR